MNRLMASTLIWVAAAGMAQALPVVVTAGGTALEGTGPAFEMRLGDKVIGTGQVSDPAPAGGQQFTFDVDDALFASSPELSLVMTNDGYKEGVGDRNLYIANVKVGDLKLVPADFAVDNAGVSGPPFEGWLVAGSQVAHAAAPAAGWISAAVATKAPAAAPAAMAATPAKAPEAKPVPTATAPIPADKKPAAAPATAVAAAAPPAKAMAECGAGVAVEGFANNAVTLTSEQQKMLDQAVSSLADCSIVVTGYSSLSGPAPVNQLVSKARAQAVADYLGASKTPPASIEVVGSGATDNFGAAAAANRRVVVELAK